MGDFAAGEVDGTGVFDFDAAIAGGGGLAIVQAVGGVEVIAVLKGDAFEADIVRGFDG